MTTLFPMLTNPPIKKNLWTEPLKDNKWGANSMDKIEAMLTNLFNIMTMLMSKLCEVI